MQDRLVAIIAHPDDEFMAAGLLIRAKSLGYKTHLISGTYGEAGRIKGQHFRGDREEELRSIRQKEFDVSCLLLNVDRYHNLGLPDNRAADWDLETASRGLEDILINIGPSIVVTFNRDGGNHHPDHIGMHKITVQAFGSLPRGDYKLYFNTLFPRNFSQVHALLELPALLMEKMTIDDNEVSAILALTNEEHLMKLSVLDIYRSQFPDERGLYYKMPLRVLEAVSRYECYENFDKGNVNHPPERSDADVVLFDLLL
ncbi:PIG-L family deacetylase [Paenibacillus harenae]|uniref:PIG-L family deacetylase n=1 Tax=Paenibacillus harenae TaxID=306543 RepID=UPI00279027AA|nr:PIG-L family deacetylase [Paenibacillus harenae]MDQ0062821.1 LmbE family N-acetylglucosaminyl deacetylase [Paenibacillus harenae]